MDGGYFKMKDNCKVCGCECSGKLKIEARKGTYYITCSYCFEALRESNLKEVRIKIKKPYR